MKNKELLIDAINNYAPYTPSYRILLKALIDLAIDDVAIVTIKKLGALTGVSRPIVYKGLKLFEEEGIVEQTKKRGSKLTSFTIKPAKLNTIVKYYEKQNLVEKKYLHTARKKVDISMT